MDIGLFPAPHTYVQISNEMYLAAMVHQQVVSKLQRSAGVDVQQ